ncbi:hypothetical protein N7533_010944 [Penicillium manginii]|uniref:uncharacterized protein n=1 Tax=Penicillium manginii TaxID=203109 RepID=UPI00254975F0|nr:uncharacterized protein N7533_010944 [Penicillium manginii]KAJ5741535.1 hypothetical protein N7533_010944 [Penicillium manginii]
MSTPSLRTGTRSLRLRSIRTNPRSTNTLALGSTVAAPRISIHAQSRNLTRNTSPGTQAQQARSAAASLSANTLRARVSQIRTYASSSNATADNLIEELQDLYEIAKDEFEIATDSTDGSTIYAASDRESARDALNQLVTVYEAYTGAKVGRTHADGEGDAGEKGTEAPVVETNFDPAGVSEEVRGGS